VIPLIPTISTEELQVYCIIREKTVQAGVRDNLLLRRQPAPLREQVHCPQVEIPPAKAADFRRFENVILSGEKGTAVLKKE
jgi:hypothetical protein